MPFIRLASRVTGHLRDAETGAPSS